MLQVETLSPPEFFDDWHMDDPYYDYYDETGSYIAYVDFDLTDCDGPSGDWLPFRLSPAAVAPAVLSTAHIRPSVTWFEGASVFSVTLGKGSPSETDKKSGGKRGVVSSFSRQSRNRLMRKISEVKRDCLPLFVTLTYPRDYQRYDFKRDLKVFLQRIRRAFPGVCGVWKLEPQKRGAPHFHLLLWGVELDEVYQGVSFSEWVASTWYAVVGSGDCYHYLFHMGLLGNEPCVSKVDSFRGVMFYVSKYMSKIISLSCVGWGRWWGVVNDDLLPRGQKITIPLERQSILDIIRYMRRFAFRKSKARSRGYRSLSIICNADFWVRQLIW